MQKSLSLPNLNRTLLTEAVLAAVVGLAMYSVGFGDLPRLLRGAGNLVVFVGDLFPPNFAITSVVLGAILETLQIAFAGTFIGFALALPLGILGARNLFSTRVTALARFVLAVVRTVPALLWAVFFVVAVGLGPLPGALAIALYSLGYLAKLYYEAFEGIDPEVYEAVKSVGCSRPQLIRFAVLPESANAVLSQLLFMFEYNVRSSAILGFVGAGGVGFYILSYLQRFQYQNLLTVLIFTLVVVLALDLLSGKLRARFLLQRLH